MIRMAGVSEIEDIKKLVDSFSEMDTIEETFSLEYYKRILIKGVLLVAEENDEIVGVCFGTYNEDEGWADLLALVVKKEFQGRGMGSNLVREFENFVRG